MFALYASRSATPKRHAVESFLPSNLRRVFSPKTAPLCVLMRARFLELDWKIGHWVPKSISDPTYALHGINCIIDNPAKEILTFARTDGAAYPPIRKDVRCVSERYVFT